MAKNPERKFDNTHLSIDLAEARGFIHRDYLAHCLRWSHIAKAGHKGEYKAHRWLDIGCGKDLPLARMLNTNRIAPTEGYFIAVDINELTMHPDLVKSKFQPKLFGKSPFVESTKAVRADVHKGPGTLTVKGSDGTEHEFDQPNFIVCLEVLEHVTPLYSRQMMAKMLELIDVGGTVFISTPCWDPEVGAADNHINEMTYHALGAMLESVGFAIVGHWGTFASQRDYKARLELEENKAVKEVYERLSGYYDSNVIANIMAPMFPAHSRNVLWELKRKSEVSGYESQFLPLEAQEERWTSSHQWWQLSGETDISKMPDWVREVAAQERAA